MQQDISFEKRDEFNRKPHTERIIKLLKSDIDLSPIVINGDWGTGKTEFCLKTLKLINSAHSGELNAVYFDAFSEDYIDQPLLSLLTVIYNAFPTEKVTHDFISSGAALLRFATKTGVNFTLRSLLGDEVANLVKEGVSHINEDELKKWFQEKAKIQHQMQLLQNSLSSLTESQKLVLFIDELDRCRPDYAMHLLEIVKHFFEIDGLRIVFVANLKQLTTSISHNYGNSEEEARKYLEKFFKIELSIPNIIENRPSNENAELAPSRYFDELVKQKALNKHYFLFSGNDGVRICFLFKELIEHFDLSLRGVEKLVRDIQIYQTLFSPSEQYDRAYKFLILYAIFSLSRNAS